MVTAAGLSAYVIVTPIVLVPLSQSVLDRVGDQFGRDDLGVVRILAQSAGAERGPHTATGLPALIRGCWAR